VPPISEDSTIATFSPLPAACLAASKPPYPAPITIKSKSKLESVTFYLLIKRCMRLLFVLVIMELQHKPHSMILQAHYAEL